MNIVEFNNSNEARIDGLYAQALQLTAESEGEYKTLAFINGDDTENSINFENSTLTGQFKDFSLYLARSDNSINITKLDVILLKVLRPDPNPSIEYTVVDNELVPLAGEPTTQALTGIEAGGYITAKNVTTVVNRINTEAARRDNSKSAGAITARGTAPTTGQLITLGDTSFGSTSANGSWANIAAPLNKISPVSVPVSAAGPDLFLATGDGTYQYLYDLAEDYSAISVTAASTGCNASCTGLCRTNCYSGCTNACTGSCGGNCTGTCKGSCSGTCRGSCTGGCTSSCNGGYRGGCSDCTYGVESGDCC